MLLAFGSAPAAAGPGRRVEVQRGWGRILSKLCNGSTVVLYDSADTGRRAGVSEGFGLHAA